MERLTKKTTILLQPELHRRLTRLAERRGTSLGELIRSACETQYGLGGSEEPHWVHHDQLEAFLGLAKRFLGVA